MTSANDAVRVSSARCALAHTRAIADVSANGLVTAKAPGRATIAAEAGALTATTEIVGAARIRATGAWSRWRGRREQATS